MFVTIGTICFHECMSRRLAVIFGNSIKVTLRLEINLKNFFAEFRGVLTNSLSLAFFAPSLD